MPAKEELAQYLAGPWPDKPWASTAGREGTVPPPLGLSSPRQELAFPVEPPLRDPPATPVRPSDSEAEVFLSCWMKSADERPLWGGCLVSAPRGDGFPSPIWEAAAVHGPTLLQYV